MIRIAVLVCALALSVTAAHGEPAKPTGPSWKRKPGPDALLSVMPKLAVERGANGKATMTCSVTALGLLKDCAVASESPEGYGFGAAAVAMAPFFQLNPALVDGKPVEGGTITVPIVWELQHGGGGPAAGRSLLVSPPWAVAPSWAQMSAAWPAKAGAAAEGFVTLRCMLSGEGAPTYCSEVSEAPERLGFADAAKELAKTFRLSFSAAEQPTLKALVVDIPFHFRNPGQGDPRKLTSPRWVRTLSPAAMATLYPMAARSAGVFTGRGWCAAGRQPRASWPTAR